MKALLAAAFAAISIVAIVLVVRDAGPARATGTGPNIALGTPVGFTVPVLATTPAVDPYAGFNIHVIAVPSAGVTAPSASFNATNTVLGAPQDILCVFSTISNLEPISGCIRVGGGSTIAAGLLTSVVVQAGGNGCVAVGLVEARPSALLSTYTVSPDSSMQSNTVNVAQIAHVLVGSGTVGDCPAGPLSTPTLTPSPTGTFTPTGTATDTPTLTSTPTVTNTPTQTLTPGAIATNTPVPPPGATATPAGNPDDEIRVIAVSTSLCLAFGGAPPLPCFALWQPDAQHRLADILSHNAPEARGCPAGIFGSANNPSADRCRLLPSDFAALSQLGPPQLHADDAANSQFSAGPFSGLYILAFVPNDQPVEFRTSAGQLVQVNDSFGPFAAIGSTYLCNGQFDDCNNDGLSLKHLVVVPLGGYGAALGPARVTVSQGTKNASLDFTVVGEPASITIDAFRTTIGNGVADIEGPIPGSPPDGKLTGPDECPLPTTQAAIQAAMSKPDRTVLIARIKDARGADVTQGWAYWSGTGEYVTNVFIGPVGHLGAPITPSYDLGSFGIGAPQVLCGTAGTGTVPVLAQITRFAGSVIFNSGVVVDPGAHTGSAGVNIEVTGPAAGTPTFTSTFTSTPTSTSTTTPVPTSTFVSGTATPTSTPTHTSTPVNTPVPTFTSTPTDTAAPATPTNTPVPTHTPSPTNTATSTATSTSSPTQTPTSYPLPATPSFTPVATDTTVPTHTSTPTMTATSTSTPAIDAVIFSLSPQHQTVPFAAGHAHVHVDIDHADDVGAFEFILRYDPAVLRDPVIEPGSFLGSTGRPIFCPGSIVDATHGIVRYGCASMGIGPGVSGAGVLATVTFAISGSGSTLLTFEKVLVVNADAYDRCPCVGNGATIDVTATTPTTTAVPTTTSVRTVTAVPTRTTTKTPVRSATAAPTRSATRTPRRTPTAHPDRCADVAGDGRVTWRDVLAEARALLRHSADARYDVNGDGRVDARDFEMTMHQLGQRCHGREHG